MLFSGEQGRELDRKLLDEYTKVTAALDRLGQSNEHVESTIMRLNRDLPQLIRSAIGLDFSEIVLIRSVFF